MSKEIINENNQNNANASEDVNAIMKKYDRESNQRIWTGKAKIAVRAIMVLFSLWCIYVTLFATFLEEIRLSSFMALIIMMGFITSPAQKDGTHYTNGILNLSSKKRRDSRELYAMV